MMDSSFYVERMITVERIEHRIKKEKKNRTVRKWQGGIQKLKTSLDVKD